MKTVVLMIYFCFTTLFFSSCEKDEMGKGGTTGGGMENSLNSKKASTILITENDTIATSTLKE